MREKLLDLMKNEGLKPSQLAELLEINPAGISHILAGRNKPGFAAQPAASGAGFDNVRKSGAAGNGSIFRHTDRRRRPANRNIVR